MPQANDRRKKKRSASLITTTQLSSVDDHTLPTKAKTWTPNDERLWIPVGCPSLQSWTWARRCSRTWTSKSRYRPDCGQRSGSASKRHYAYRSSCPALYYCAHYCKHDENRTRDRGGRGLSTVGLSSRYRCWQRRYRYPDTPCCTLSLTSITTARRERWSIRILKLTLCSSSLAP